MEAARTAIWAKGRSQCEGAENEARWLDRTLHSACDASMPRSRRSGDWRGKKAYWWTPETAEARRVANNARQRFLRARRRQRGQPDTTEITLARREYRDARYALRDRVKRAKREAWEELLRTIDDDPWGRPYSTVMGRLRAGTRPVTEGLRRDELGSVLDDLFPPVTNTTADDKERRRVADETSDWSREREVTVREVRAAVARMARKRTAPGPDGIHGVVAAVMPAMEDRLRETLDACLREGVFPGAWKGARLVLVPKPGRTGKTRYRPICVIGEAGKILERVIAGRSPTTWGRWGPI